MSNIEIKSGSKRKPVRLKTNIFLQASYQFVNLIIPLIVSPFLTRVLGETNLGIYSYVNSIAYYFVLASMLGISTYGQRLIAEKKNDEQALRKSFWSLYCIHLMLSLVVLLIYVALSLFAFTDYTSIYLIQSLYVLSAAFDITWFFFGLEEFKGVIFRNLFVKIIETVLIFSLVNDKASLNTYIWIESSSILFRQVMLFPVLFRKAKPIRFTFADCLDHLRPLLLLSIVFIAVSLYTVFDKTILGIMTTKEEVAYYTYADKIITVPKTIIGTISTVMYPRACDMVNKGETEKARKYMKYSLYATSALGFGSMFGLIVLGRQLAIIYYGDTFLECGNMIMLMAPLVYIVMLGDIVRLQYMVPNKMDKQYTFCIICNAIINLILSISLIPVLGAYGAIVGTLGAELFGTVSELYLSRKFLSFKEVVLNGIPFFAFGGVMSLVLYFIQKSWNYSVTHLILLITIGLLIFCLESSVWWIIKRRNTRKNSL